MEKGTVDRKNKRLYNFGWSKRTNGGLHFRRYGTMVMYKVFFTKQAVKDLEKLKQAGISSKAKLLVDIIKNAPYQTPPRYEKLVGNLDGIISRRINIQHRLVYQVYEDEFTEDDIKYQGTIKIIRMWTRYDNVR